MWKKMLIAGCMMFLSACQRVVPIEPVNWKEGVSLNALFISKQGIERTPYYMIAVKEDKVYAKSTSMLPIEAADKNLIDIQNEPGWEYFYQINQVHDYESASIIELNNHQYQRLISIIEKSGALSWNGYNESIKDKRLDSGIHYELYLLCSDDSRVEMKGYNICPEGFDLLYWTISEFFN